MLSLLESLWKSTCPFRALLLMFAGFRDERSSTDLQLPRTLCKIALMRINVPCAQEGVM